MKRLLALPIAVLALIGLPQIAFAGPQAFSGKEMKEVAPAPAPECNWTGFYVGALAGYARGDLVWTDSPETGETQGVETLVDRDQSGALYGGELGFNYQWHWLVLGLEGTFAYSDVQAHTVTKFKDEPNTFDTRSNWQGTIGGRLGLAWNKFLFFAKGGAALNEQTYYWQQSEPVNRKIDSFKTDETRVGGLVGGGIEYMVNCHWSVKVEYDHAFLGTDTITAFRTDRSEDEETPSLGQTESYNVKLNQDTVWFGVNYKFWGF
jgi:outer membrane immunogenic protein